MKDRGDGFTLIEILVVITIIAALMGMVVVLIKPGLTTQNKTITTTRIQKIASALELLRSAELLGMYPPAEITALRGPKGEEVGRMAGMPNDINVGIESVFVATHLSTVNVRIDVKDDAITNLDGDMMGENPTRLAKKDLFEYVDAWGNPLVYFSAREYKKWGEKGQKVQMGDEAGGEIVDVRPHVSEKTGLPLNQNTFQLFSAGPDMVFGTADDIGNW